MEKSNFDLDTKTEEFICKASVLSYYIATYNAVNGELGLDGEPVTVDEIFEFINDLKHEGGYKGIVNITKSDVSQAFGILVKAGLAKQNPLSLASLSN